MKRCLLLVLFGVLVAGCTQSQPTVALTALCFPPEPETGGCVYASECEQILMNGDIKVDVSITNLDYSGNTLEWPIEVRNQAWTQIEEGSGRVNSSDAHITEFQMSYESSEVSLPATEAISPQDIRVPAEGVTVAEVHLMPRAFGLALENNLPVSADRFSLIMVNVKAVGHLDNGVTFETAEKQVPVWVCNGCWGSPTPPVCSTATDQYIACPQWGQYSVGKCVTP